MPKGPKITDAIKNTIAGVYLKHPDWPAYKIQREVHIKLKSDYPGIPPSWPGISAIQKVLSKLRVEVVKRSGESHKLDRPWSIDTLYQHEIPPETLRTVLNMAIHFRQSIGEGRLMTIREALWAARLSSLKDLRKLPFYIKAYAEQEMIAEITHDFTSNPEGGLDFLLYRDLTNRSFNARVFDDWGKEIIQDTPANIIEEVQELHRRIREERNKKGGG